MTDDMPEFVSGSKTPADWKKAKARLSSESTEEDGLQAFEDFFRDRLELRYLGPIKTLQVNGTLTGEGFAIATIQCALVEFIEACIQGRSYRYVRPPAKLGQFEYSSSRELFKTFLTTRQPFASEFDAVLADDFYENVRCALLHEARTKKGWRIWAFNTFGAQDQIVDKNSKIFYRDNFQIGLETLIADYRAELITNDGYKQAFIRKFDDLCE